MTVTIGGTYRGGLVLQAQPFRTWLLETMAHRGWTHTDVATIAWVTEDAVRRWTGEKVDASTGLPTKTVTEVLVERVGIALLGDPRLAPTLYPELDF